VHIDKRNSFDATATLQQLMQNKVLAASVHAVYLAATCTDVYGICILLILCLLQWLLFCTSSDVAVVAAETTIRHCSIHHQQSQHYKIA
jgi:hypothetical protein